ncbi:hypothetical protein OHS33_38185 (plasmid) [Streptomyces sp. NBC_00536]|uniref:hypothetical protein n=1 Tax=Streptomyces sp. NBC_00536 TaxID=2975769 RepID=UPI002E8113B7|nr:hypothetical protein [Streptomyces sp. NBC_00536]WUC84232.1 hypothetical protein OHS33_38185 [Streptomyces sp. NBC_00536]
MTGDDWILATFAVTPLALFAIGLTVDVMSNGSGWGTGSCRNCRHGYEQHRSGADQGAGRCTVVSEGGTRCDCLNYEYPSEPEQSTGHIGCGG